MPAVLLGAVENMSGFRCRNCGEAIYALGRVADERSVLRELDRLVRIPLDAAYGHVNGIASVFAELAERVVGKLA